MKKVQKVLKAQKAAARPELEAALDRVRALQSEIGAVLLQTEEKVRQLEYLTRFSGILNSSLDPAIVRERALEATCQLLRCETASLLLIDPKKGELYWETALGETGKKLAREFRLAINDQSIAGWVAMHGESVIINDVQSDRRHFKKVAAPSTSADSKSATPAFVTRTMICVPLKSKDKVIGVLQALNKLASIPPQKSQHGWPDFIEDDRALLETLSHQVAIAVDNSKLYTDLKLSFYDTVEALSEAIEKKDSYTGGHTKRVVHYSLCIAKYMDLAPEVVERIRLGALLHDIGKIGVEDKILKKNAQLDSSEWEVMQQHPELGYDILNRVESLKDVIDGMRYHHERWDGKGYPLKLKGEEIPLIARIISIADTYDAMVSTRPYRKGLDPKFAYDEIVRYSGTQFDPQCVEAFKLAFQHEKMGPGSGGSRR